MYTFGDSPFGGARRRYVFTNNRGFPQHRRYHRNRHAQVSLFAGDPCDGHVMVM